MDMRPIKFLKIVNYCYLKIFFHLLLITTFSRASVSACWIGMAETSHVSWNPILPFLLQPPLWLNGPCTEFWPVEWEKSHFQALILKWSPERRWRRGSVHSPCSHHLTAGSIHSGRLWVIDVGRATSYRRLDPWMTVDKISLSVSPPINL